MGLCKCPKKKVTNQFCFEHRVNVCEYCLVSSHPRCIVKSYLHWLQDSDYNPVCTLCNGELSEGDVVRLVCYDVFHWNCINNFAASLPPNTAPAGYTCPNCKANLFPPDKMISPVCDQLRQKLSTVMWARAGLGVPVVQATTATPTSSVASTESPVPRHNVQTEAVVPSQAHMLQSMTSVPNTPQAHSTPFTTPISTRHAEQRTHSERTSDVRQQTTVPPPAPHVGHSWKESHGTVARKILDGRQTDAKVEISVDHDENKYERRGAVDWVTKWFGTRRPAKHHHDDPNAPLKRVAVFAVIVLLGLITTIVIMTRVGRGVADKDPFLDPMANPNIRVHRGIGG